MNNNCIICNNKNKILKLHSLNKIFYCNKCNFFQAEITKICNGNSKIHYDQLLNSISYLRIKNFNKILDKIENLLYPKSLGLEVGCATGIFMELAKQKKYNMVGIEPMHSSFKIAKNKKLNVLNIFFSKDFYYDKKFDFIIFNDVFEHIPNIKEIIKKCNELLNKNGLLIINLPLSTGFLYKIAIILNRFGTSMFLNRLWQFDTESPHLYYFNSKNLKILLSENNFKFIDSISQKTFTIRGLFSRINSSIKSKIISSIIFFFLILSLPFIVLLPKDTRCFIFKKTN